MHVPSYGRCHSSHTMFSPPPFHQGDGSKVVFGMCISDCSGTGSNANAAQTVGIMRQLQAAHPDMGGMMFWDTQGDKDGAWSKPTYKYVPWVSMCACACVHVMCVHMCACVRARAGVVEDTPLRVCVHACFALSMPLMSGISGVTSKPSKATRRRPMPRSALICHHSSRGSR